MNAVIVYEDAECYALGFDYAQCIVLEDSDWIDVRVRVAAGPEGTMRRRIYLGPFGKDTYFTVIGESIGGVKLDLMYVSGEFVALGNDPRFVALAASLDYLLFSNTLDWDQLFKDRALGSGWEKHEYASRN